MSSFTNRKSSAQKRFVLSLRVNGSRLQCEYSKEQREKIPWVCELQIGKLGFEFWSAIVGFVRHKGFLMLVEDFCAILCIDILFQFGLKIYYEIFTILIFFVVCEK